MGQTSGVYTDVTVLEIQSLLRGTECTWKGVGTAGQVFSVGF